ncbi:6-phosphofructokinase, alpha subunit [Boothiomyces sp. JEL0866]|nr:6-phosphofructokinase, alpha subunit [Boothiomyces sp. JEL0866]
MNNLSQVTVAAPNQELFEKALNFYLDLGFKIIEQHPDKSYLHYFSHVGIDLCIVKGELMNQSFSITVPKENVAVKVDPMGNIVNFVASSRYEVEPPTVTLPVPSQTPVPKPIVARNKKIGILTSGGDSCGMNAAVRSITRVSLQKGCIPFAIYEGYQGLVDGGDKIKELRWDDVRGYLAKGGTLIGTARCKEFRTREGRLKSCYNLIKNGIDALVIIGGDGSLTGADTFRAEWTGLVDELVSTGKLTEAESLHLRNDLAIVGLVGSIDNDMSSTDITIGAVTSLHRICESVDSLTSTAQSHQRAFVIEVMGRHCGWLALMAAIAVGADCCFLPERPPPFNQEKYGNDWEKEMNDIVSKNRTFGNRKSLVIVCEGAIDRDLNPIKAEQVKKALEKIGLDTRVTTLGHVQRGGSTCAFDRYLATVQGVEAVEAVLRSNRDVPAPMIGMFQNKIVSIPLMEAVKLTQEVATSIAKKDFAHAMQLRDPEFTSSFNSYLESGLRASLERSEASPKNLRVAILHCGAPAGGMNAATRVLVRLCHSRGFTPLAIRNGFSGLVNGEVSEMNWEDVRGWQVMGGTQLGTNRDHPEPIQGINSNLNPSEVDNLVNTGAIAFNLQKHNINALVIIGGFEGFSAQIALTEARKLYPALCIPMVYLPATISNNIPGTDFSIGSDTALNVIVEACDRIRLSANASRKRVFVVEVHGGNCGYLSTMSALTVGASSSYIPEEGLSIETLHNDVKHLIRRYTEEIKSGIANEGRVILRSENTQPKVYSTSVISGILRAEGKGLFDSKEAVLGHLQQGDIPSPMDRIRATRLAVSSMDWIEKVVGEIKPTTDMPTYTTDEHHSCVIGVVGSMIVPTPILDARELADMKKRVPKESWWMGLRPLIRILGKREYHDQAKL